MEPRYEIPDPKSKKVFDTLYMGNFPLESATLIFFFHTKKVVSNYLEHNSCGPLYSPGKVMEGVALKTQLCPGNSNRVVEQEWGLWRHLCQECAAQRTRSKQVIGWWHREAAWEPQKLQMMTVLE